MTPRFDHVCDHERREFGTEALQAIERDAMTAQQLADLGGAERMRDELFEPIVRDDHRPNCSRNRTSESYSNRIS